MKKIIILLNLFVVGFTYAQTNLTQTENYIYEKNCLTEDCSKKIESVQYLDGLGRARQTIAIKATPSGKDIAVPIEYDAYGRQVKSYLPVPQSGTQNGALYTNPLSNAASIYGNEKIYAEKVLESSPLGRPQQQKQVGNDWAGHPVQFSYEANTSADAVKKYTVVTSWVEGRTNSELSLSGAYPENTLYKSAVTDEDGNVTTQFKNKKGQTILTRKKDGTQNADTYYVYNEYGGLAYTLPPLASASTLTPTVLDNLCYQYRYDGWNRLVEKKIPGKGWEYMVYNKADQLILTQDTILKGKGQWLFIKYDQFGRTVYTGITNNPASRASIQNSANINANLYETRTATAGWTLNGMPVYYTKLSTPTGITQILSINYYDTYPSYSFNPAFPNTIMGKTLLSDNSTANAVSTKSLPVMNFVKNIEDDNWTKNYIYYDSKGRAIGSHSINHLGGYSKTESELDFIGVPQKSNVYHVRKPGEPGVIIKQHYVYDSGNRLLQHYHQVDDKPEELLSENTYNELSQITSRKVGNNLQSIDYTYNIRGWLSDINKNQMGLADLGGKLFSYAIRYNQKNGIDNPDPAQFSGKNVTPKYNGNITEVDWRAVETVGVNPSLTPKRYGYAYDSMNRMTAGYYQNPGNPYSKENTESLSYDLNGNISKLYRTSVTEYGSNTATVIDNLNYIYTGNQATNINDLSQNPTGYEGGGNTITYDQNGNMLTMPDKGISSITYNYLNLPTDLHVNKSGNEDVTINTKYRADGTKLSKENTTTITGFNGFTTTKRITDYLDGFQYLRTENSGSGGDPETLMLSSMSARAMQPQAYTIVTDPTVQPVGGSFTANLKTPDLQYLPTAEGFYDYQKDQYIYQYKDHLGNVRVSYGRNSAGALEITDSNDYYPFGMNHLKTGNAFFGRGSYKDNKYNGKELQETGMYSYGWREYMPDLGRWNGIDQLAESYLSTSPYAYVANNPVLMTDPDGRWMDDTGHITDTTGQAFGFHGSSYRPLLSFSTYDGMHTNEGAGVTDNGNNRIAQGPKPNIFKTIGNFFRRLVGKSKHAAVGVLSVGVITLETIAPSIEMSAAAAEAAGYGRIGIWGLPLMLNGDSGFSANSKPITGAIDIPVTTTADESSPDKTITLYRGVSSNAGIAYDEALLGIATANGFRLSFNGIPHSNMASHASGDNNSIWTSWTPMKDVATRFALGRNKSGGVLLTKTFTVGQAIPNTSFMAMEYFADEYEYLVPGIVVGAQVTPIKK
ncbi:RHS repeat-associated core domain-containing protein [Chryseobacterium viscerum]|uniref:RHS repeat-associated core domain-containing protein n=1 Tax=Chryseobacterium viscerum TaxID=1037377 RepID=UPI002222C3A7|nr:RHS repeat-associated core domain-containing protein [Chryseobacterium viscerum]MCW1962904.1 RHS repeat-associated core domain-containing protein [Chryseobacterium viscerum]